MPVDVHAKQRQSVCIHRAGHYTMHMLQVTVGQVLSLEIFQESQPQLISRPLANANDASVRWMHILETARPEGLLPGGEFILTTATFLDRATNSNHDGIRAANQFLDTIEATGAVAVAAEILEHREHVIAALSQAAQDRKFPIFILRNRIRFVELTQFVHENIAAARLQEIETDRSIHETFTRLSVGSASTDRIVAEASALLNSKVVWEAHEQQSSIEVQAEHQVVAGNENLGRLLITDNCNAEDSLVQTVLERAAQAVSISVLAKRSQQEMRRSMATALFYQLRGGTDLSDQEVLWRLAETFDLPTLAAQQWWPVVFRIWSQQASEEILNRFSGVLLDVLEQVGVEKRLPVLAARSEIGVVDVLLPFSDPAVMNALIQMTHTRFIARLRGQGQLVAGVGTQSTSAKTAAGQLFDTAQIAEAAQAYVSATGRHRAYFFAKDLGLRGLLATLREHDQLVSFVSTELTALASATGSRRAFEQQLEFLAAVLSAENKTALARSLHLSRPALYARVTRLERQLGYSLEDDAEQRTATHLALMAYRVNPDGVYAVLRQRF